jgi:hypothetical protein
MFTVFPVSPACGMCVFRSKRPATKPRCVLTTFLALYPMRVD